MQSDSDVDKLFQQICLCSLHLDLCFNFVTWQIIICVLVTYPCNVVAAILLLLVQGLKVD